MSFKCARANRVNTQDWGNPLTDKANYSSIDSSWETEKEKETVQTIETIQLKLPILIFKLKGVWQERNKLMTVKLCINESFLYTGKFVACCG